MSAGAAERAEPAAACVWIVGAGYLGAAVAAALRDRGGRVLTIDHRPPADVVGCASSPDTYTAALKQGVPTAVLVSLSTRGGTVSDYQKTYLDTIQVLRHFIQGAKLLFCSSVSVYGVRDGSEVSEITPCSPLTRSGYVLLQTEAIVTSELHGGVARLAPIYGPGRCELWRRHIAGEPRLPGPDERYLNYLHISDAVESILFLLKTQWEGGDF